MNNVVKRVELGTYGAYTEATDTQVEKIFSVPEKWLKDVLAKEFDWALDEFLNEYTWDNSEQVLNMAKAAGVVEYPEEICYEWCPDCEREVELKHRFEVQICPSCGNYIIPCNACERDKHSCLKCPLQKPAESEEV